MLLFLFVEKILFPSNSALVHCPNSVAISEVELTARGLWLILNYSGYHDEHRYISVEELRGVDFHPGERKDVNGLEVGKPTA